MERPSEEEVQATAARTKAALEKLVSGKIKAAQPKNVPETGGAFSALCVIERGAIGLELIWTCV